MVSMILAILGAALWLIFAAAVGNFAEKRGHSGTLWYLFCLFFSPLVGFVILALLPSAAALSRDVRQCPHCSAMVRVESDVCPVCHRELGEKAKEKLAA